MLVYEEGETIDGLVICDVGIRDQETVDGLMKCDVGICGGRNNAWFSDV